MKKAFFISSIFVLPLASGAYIFKDIIENQLNGKNKNVDSTRFGSLNYGMKWGSKTDEIIESKIETGDIILCQKIDIINDIKRFFLWRKIFVNQFYENFDIAGLLVRSPSNLYVVNVKGGNLNFENYSDFILNNTKDFIKIRFKNKKINYDKSLNSDVIEQDNKCYKEFFEKLK